jgi:hypothetical protein
MLGMVREEGGGRKREEGERERGREVGRRSRRGGGEGEGEGSGGEGEGMKGGRREYLLIKIEHENELVRRAGVKTSFEGETHVDYFFLEVLSEFLNR